MYPMHTWGYEPLIKRLERLIEEDLVFEAVIAANQTHEQTFKRVMRGEMAERRVTLKRKKDTFLLVEASTAAHLDKGLRQMPGMAKMAKAWQVLHKGRSCESLEETVSRIAGPQGWDLVVELADLRHRLVHETASPMSSELQETAQSGIESLRKLLHPQSGLTAFGVRDPFARIPNILHSR